MISAPKISFFLASIALAILPVRAAEAPALPPSPASAAILTPPAPATPRINGPTVFGVRAGHPFFYAIPATGERPMQFGAAGLPAGLTLDPATGMSTGRLAAVGDFPVLLQAKNKLGDASWRFGVSEIAFSQDAWAASAGPGHWNDPDMLVVGKVGWGPALRPTNLTPDEQYSHITMWCLLSAPLLIGCDLEQLDPLTLSLLSNDEVLAVDQDALGRQATRVATVGAINVHLKPLEDGSHAIAFFNRSSTKETFEFNKFDRLGLGGTVLTARNLWRQQDRPVIKSVFAGELPAHGVRLLKIARRNGA
jgi:hypothetical protein